MKITFIIVGKTAEKYLQTGIDEYVKRLSYYCQFSIVEIPDLKVSSKISSEEIKKKEGALIVAKIPEQAEVVLLDENGKEYTSRKFAGFIEQKQNQSVKELVFVIGGAYGFSVEVYSIVRQRLSLSQMTFSHQMIRLFFVEQLYRAFAIIHNLPYHHD